MKFVALTLFTLIISVAAAPASDPDRLVWGSRLTSILFLSDDYIDSGKMMDRVSGFKQAASGEGVRFSPS